MRAGRPPSNEARKAIAADEGQLHDGEKAGSVIERRANGPALGWREDPAVGVADEKLTGDSQGDAWRDQQRQPSLTSSPAGGCRASCPTRRRSSRSARANTASGPRTIVEPLTARPGSRQPVTSSSPLKPCAVGGRRGILRDGAATAAVSSEEAARPPRASAEGAWCRWSCRGWRGSITSSAASGSSRMRRPVALKTALAIAPAVPTWPISPTPSPAG